MSEEIKDQEVVVIKWGGSLITNKAASLTPKPRVMAMLARAVRDYLLNSVGMIQRRVVIVHGAGSFGHLRARAWRLASGRLPHARYAFPEDDPSRIKASSQDDAVRLVRQEMLQLNKFVCEALVRVGIRPVVHPPHYWARNTGPTFSGELIGRFLADEDPLAVDVTFGDVVNTDGTVTRDFGILSGDDLVVRLAKELPNVRRVIFAIGGGVDGLLSKPPSQGGNNSDHLLQELTPEAMNDHDGFEGALWSDEIDVTGGIGLKAIRGMQVAQHCDGNIEVLVINGEKPERIVAGMRGEAGVIATRIRATTTALSAKL